jgi:ZIP family zinc transporter
MNPLSWIVTVTAISGVGGTGLGGLIGAAFRRGSDKAVSLLLSFAGGVMLGVVCFDLLVSAIDPGGSFGAPAGLGIAVFGVLLGYGIISALNTIIDRTAGRGLLRRGAQKEPVYADPMARRQKRGVTPNPSRTRYPPYAGASHRQRRSVSSSARLFAAGIVMAFAIALHNLPEGMVIGASGAGAALGVTFSGAPLILAVVIGLHNLPEGMAVSTPLIAGGMGRIGAVLVTALSGAPTVLGALLGYHMGMAGPLSFSLSLSFASGAMLYVVFGELLPAATLMGRSKEPALAALAGLITSLLIIRV